jgi:hypothetical protein
VARSDPPRPVGPAAYDTGVTAVDPGRASRARPAFGRGWDRRARRVAAGAAGAAGLVLLLAGATAVWWRLTYLPPVQAVPGAVPPAHTWTSGAWTGGNWSPDRVAAFGAWRGSPVDTVTAYPAYQTWAELAGSDWNVGVFDGFTGRLAYGLPLLPKAAGTGTLADVAAGRHDDAFTAVAKTLAQHGRGDAFVRIGLEANGDWFPWGASKDGNDPAGFRAAYRHVAGVLRASAPRLTLVFDIGCGHALRDQTGRLDSLTALYPGDDVVDVVGCDHYDAHATISRNSAQFATSLRPADAAGLQDVVDFARGHRKGFAVPEWGLTTLDAKGGGDDPYYIYAMYRFFQANAADLAFENYFNEPDPYIANSIWDVVQQPNAAAEYRRLWSATR